MRGRGEYDEVKGKGEYRQMIGKNENENGEWERGEGGKEMMMSGSRIRRR